MIVEALTKGLQDSDKQFLINLMVREPEEIEESEENGGENISKKRKRSAETCRVTTTNKKKKNDSDTPSETLSI